MDSYVNKDVVQTKSRLSSEDLVPYRSDYLSGGWKKDEVVLNYVQIDSNNTYIGNFSVIECFVPNDGIFHLTVPLAFICVAQVAIIGSCLDLDIAAKPGEVFLRRVDIKCKNPIHATEGIEVSLQLHNRIFLEKSVYYDGIISICNGDFVGSGSFIMPLPEKYSEALPHDQHNGQRW